MKYIPEPKNIVGDFFAVEATNWKPINKEGYVISKWGKPTKGFLGDYYRTNITPDKVMAVHRVLALTFMECPGNPDDFEVNHKDGNKLNNHISNLEWVTKSENIKHASDTGLLDKKEIKIMDIYSGVVTVRYGYKAVARFLGTDSAGIVGYLNNRFKYPYRNKWSIVYGGEEFPTFTDVTYFGYGIDDNNVIVASPINKDKPPIVFPSFRAAKLYDADAEINKVSNGYLYINLTELSKEDKDTIREEGTFREDLIDRDNPDVKKPRVVSITDSNGNKETFFSLRQLHKAKFSNIPYNTFRAIIKRYNGSIGNDKIEFII